MRLATDADLHLLVRMHSEASPCVISPVLRTLLDAGTDLFEIRYNTLIIHCRDGFSHVWLTVDDIHHKDPELAAEQQYFRWS